VASSSAQMDLEEQRARMVEEQLRRRGIADSRVLAAMGEIPREAFIPEAHKRDAYFDGALPLSHGQTISQPLMVAMSAEALRLKGDETVLEVGAGSGYQAAVLSRLAKKVYAIEIIPELVAGARRAIGSLGIDNVELICADGRKGWPEAAPYDGGRSPACPSRATRRRWPYGHSCWRQMGSGPSGITQAGGQARNRGALPLRLCASRPRQLDCAARRSTQ
jgi:protein-L-isoaspartate(D-aspartate) O-methyltransferase